MSETSLITTITDAVELTPSSAQKKVKQTIHSNILSTEKRKAQIIWALNLVYFQDKLKKKILTTRNSLLLVLSKSKSENVEVSNGCCFVVLE